MGKVNTIFSYFSKTPKKTTENQVLSPKTPNNSGSNSNVQAASNNTTPTSSKKTNEKNGESTPEFEVGDIVWSKLEGYPWWPSIVCNHPTSKVHIKKGKVTEIHVQFFDDPISRAWVKARFVKPFTGADAKEARTGGQFFSMDMSQRKATNDADKAMKMTKEDRLGLITELQPSEDEFEMDDLDDMFDEEMEEGDSDKSKENLDVSKTVKEKSSKSKEDESKSSKPPRRNANKRRRIIVEADSGDSSDDYKASSGSESDSDSASSGVDEDKLSDTGSEPEASPVKKTSRKRKLPGSTPTSVKKSLSSSTVTPERSPFVGSISSATKSKLSLFSAPDSSSASTGDKMEPSTYLHMTLDFLKPEKLKDKNGRLKTHPDYDSRTLYVPDSFKSKVTPAMRQWWEMKSNHFDTILFFKVGKFYELFHMDAVIGVAELGLIYMKGDYAHSGFPEIAYGRYSDLLVQKGYKVARVEQTETPDMMTERVKKMHSVTKFDKVMKREICRITTKGTKTYSYMEGDCCESANSYLMAVTEKEENDGCFTYGVCFVDTSIGKFHIGQFLDDRHNSRFRTLLMHHTPAQILYERGKVYPKTMQIINNLPGNVIREGLNPGTEFWQSSKTLKTLSECNYFVDEESKEIVWPAALKKMLSDSDALNSSAADAYVLAVSALGAILWYLKHTLVDEELLSMKNFEEYVPLDKNNSVSVPNSSVARDFSGKRHMVLDDVTLCNLDITENGLNGSREGTLLEKLDHCNTPFGKRLFRTWLCAPLCNPKSINDRLDSLEDLMNIPDVSAETRELLKKLPDLERILSRIHALGLSNRSNEHPDNRAILYESVTYSKRKIEDFISALEGFKVAQKIIKPFQDKVDGFKSILLRKTVTVKSSSSSGCFPDMAEKLKYFDNGFDHNKAKKDGVIVPNKGVDSDYDGAVKDIKETTNALDRYLDQQRQLMGCKSMVYWGTGKNRYQMEVPENMCKKVPNQYELMSSKKGWKRYRTKEIERMFAEMTDAEDRRSAALKDTMRRIFHQFDTDYQMWDQAVQCLAVLDVLLCLAEYSRCGEGAICRPEIVLPEADSKPFLLIREGRHPCIGRSSAAEDFIPNDTMIGVKDNIETEDPTTDSQVVLVTGPNMGGKSTLMRQVGLIVVMAQMGCYVPAEKCQITPVDRVFTRLGANDRIMAGESTFFVELSETASILQHATENSLVLLDELGRGTATYDGTAIAAAVVEEISKTINCRTLFSTHYHSLTDMFSSDPNVRLGHMACMVENESEDDPTQETITFLYKFVKGACPKSYGFNAARLASIPNEIITNGVKKAKELENKIQRIHLIRDLWKFDAKSSTELKQLVQAIG
ncbi:mismatch repair Msh6 [Octopus vulgaris]|uniref:DNA mismatch repair protein n=1 Tax=Octopus vulgaris TaxID=6645 RepID=A0AA36ARG1_OCTVU|nr:mismatch repair Msh6 [Octopus vulgaris]